MRMKRLFDAYLMRNERLAYAYRTLKVRFPYA